MNIIFLMGTYPNYGGVEKVSTILANEFVQRGYGVSIISFEQPFPELALKELNPNIKLYKLEKPVYTKKNIQKLSTIIQNQKIDILINQWAVPFYVARLCHHALKGSNCKLITVHHNIPNTNARIKDIEIRIENKIGNLWLNKIKLNCIRFISRLSLKYTYNKSDKYVVLSPSFVDKAGKFIFNSDTKKIVVIPNPITIPQNNLNEEPYNKEKQIIYVGRIEYNQKRTFRIIDIWKELEPQFKNWTLLIVGDGPDKKDLENRIKQNKLRQIKVMGFNDPINFYKKASILLLTSEYEGFPLVLLESMSYKNIPVVYGSFSAVYDIIDSGENGFISPPPFSAASMANILKELIINEDKRITMALKAQQKAQQFTLTTIVDQWENLFKQLI